MAASKVFISYSHDSPEHQDRVLALSNRLRREGVDCVIDQYEESPAEGWPIWCERQVEQADFVLIVCTKTYLCRYQQRDDFAKGLGVTFEGHIITQELYNSQGRNNKFIPITTSSEDAAFIPLQLQSATHYCFDDEYEVLYRRITNQPLTPKPQLGGVRPMAPRQVPASLPSLARKQLFDLPAPVANPSREPPATADWPQSYTPSEWEKITTAVIAILIIVLVGYLVIRNQAFADPNLVVLTRVLLSLAIAALGATIPGFLNVGWDSRGVLVRAGGALALFVITFSITPKVLLGAPPGPIQPEPRGPAHPPPHQDLGTWTDKFDGVHAHDWRVAHGNWSGVPANGNIDGPGLMLTRGPAAEQGLDDFKFFLEFNLNSGPSEFWWGLRLTQRGSPKKWAGYLFQLKRVKERVTEKDGLVERWVVRLNAFVPTAIDENVDDQTDVSRLPTLRELKDQIYVTKKACIDPDHGFFSVNGLVQGHEVGLSVLLAPKDTKQVDPCIPKVPADFRFQVSNGYPGGLFGIFAPKGEKSNKAILLQFENP
jgi:hypothetical protein